MDWNSVWGITGELWELVSKNKSEWHSPIICSFRPQLAKPLKLNVMSPEGWTSKQATPKCQFLLTKLAHLPQWFLDIAGLQLPKASVAIMVVTSRNCSIMSIEDPALRVTVV